MSKIILSAARHPAWVIAALCCITILALTRLPNLNVEIAAEGMMIDNPPALVDYQRTMETFGSENVTIIYLEDPNLFEAENLSAISQVLKRIEKIPQVTRTVSLFSVRYLRTVDGYIHTDPYLSSIPETRQDAALLIEAALLNPLIERNLLSASGSVMAINLFFDMENYHRGFDEQVALALDQAIEPLQKRFRKAFHLGDPSIRSAISEQIRSDQLLILPLALVVLITTLAITLGNWKAPLIPLLTAGMSIIWILGLMAALGIPVNVMTSIVPVLLIIVGSTEDIHLLSEYQAALRKGKSNQLALSLMAKYMGMAILLTFATTALGFLSISLNRIDLLQQFGLISALGLAINFLITITLVPASLQLASDSGLNTLSATQRPYAQFSSHLFQQLSRYPKVIISSILLLMSVCLIWATQITINNNVMDYFTEQSELPEQTELLHQNLSGMQALSIVLSGTQGTFLQVPYLEELRRLQDYLEETGQFDKSFSFADFIAVVHSGIDNEWPGTIYLPARNEVVKEYMSLLDHENAASFVSADYSQARILVRHAIGSSYQLNAVVDEIKTYAGEWMDPTLKITITGGSYLNSQAVDHMADGQAKSLILMLLVIFLLVALLFMNLKAGIIAVVANAFPIVVLFGIMGMTGIALDTGTTMVGAIALGICVDHTMHFMVRYQRLAIDFRSESDALLQVIQQESTPIMATALALAAGFLTLTFSNFPPVSMFGLLSAIVMCLALVGTFILIPLMLRNTRLISVWSVLSLHLRRDVLDKCPLFKGMRPWQVRKLVALSRIREYQPDEAILQQGMNYDTMLVLLKGEAEVWHTRRDGSTFHVTTYQPGGVFGVTSLVSNRQRQADVVAVGKVQALSFRWHSIHRIARLFPRIASRFHENLSTTIAGRLLHMPYDLSYQDEVTGLYSATFIQKLLDFTADKAHRYEEQLCLMILRIEGEDFIIENHERQVLRWLFREITQTVNQVLRKVDLLSRWGTGEFIIILPRTDHNTLDEIACRLKSSLNRMDYGVTKGVTIQARCAHLRNGDTAESLINRAKSNQAIWQLTQAESREISA
ncbi:MAG: MMPL family transporter [Candidatus Thiodiazotropha sp. 6PLUC2]